MTWAGHKLIQCVGGGYQKERGHLKNLGIDGRIIKLISKEQNDNVYWIILAQDRDKWRAVVKRVMNIGLRKC